jgi:hypothetical protein
MITTNSLESIDLVVATQVQKPNIEAVCVESQLSTTTIDIDEIIDNMHSMRITYKELGSIAGLLGIALLIILLQRFYW